MLKSSLLRVVSRRNTCWSLPDKRDNTERWGGPGASHENAKQKPVHKSDGRAFGEPTNTPYAHVSGGGGERELIRSFRVPMHYILAFIAVSVALPPAAWAGQPTGEGDPAARACMYVERPTGAVGGGTLCKTNAEWAQLKQDGVRLDQFGEPMAPPDSRNVADHGCVHTYGGGPGRDGTRPLSFQCH